VEDRLPQVLFVSLLGGAAAFVLATSGALPERVATHFGAAGQPNAYMTQAGYRLYMLVMTLGFPALMVVAISWLPRRFPHLTNIPRRDYWMAPERREQALALLARRALWLGCALVLFACAVHWLLLRAHAATPPRLPTVPFLVLLAVFLAFVGAWALALYRAFKGQAS
jgi:hypothetical protein